MSQRVVLAIDPGSSKCGLALVHRDLEGKLKLMWRKIVPVGQLIDSIGEAADVQQISLIVIGSGTGSKPIIKTIRDEMPSMGILVIDETDTTLQARERYWEYNPRRGWRRFFPATMQSPPEPVDDFAALVLAERVLQA
jgi:RNase H-fold protein (predicted Holliday junction resolvase)